MQARFYMRTIFYAKPLINSTSNDPCYRQVYLCMKIALNIHLTWCAELYIRALVELEWVNVSENLHDKTGWLHSERFSLILSKNVWSIFLLIERSIYPMYLLGSNRVKNLLYSVWNKCIGWTFMKTNKLLNCWSLWWGCTFQFFLMKKFGQHFWFRP